MEQTPPVSGLQSPSPPPPAMSLAARLFNVFAAPGEVFEEVKSARAATANWLVPVLISSVLGAVSAFIIYSQPAVVQQIHDQQTQMYDKQVQVGKMTQIQADQAAEMAEKFSGPTMLALFGSIGVVFDNFALLFWWAFVLWLLARFYLKVPLDYLKLMEVVGLAGMIGALAVVVKTLLIVVTGNLYAAPGLILLVKKFDPHNPVHYLLALADVMMFWLLAVRSIGLAKLTGVSFGKAAVPIFGIWAVIAALLTGFALAMLAISGR
jgi:hypothetical protein